MNDERIVKLLGEIRNDFRFFVVQQFLLMIGLILLLAGWLS